MIVMGDDSQEKIDTVSSGGQQDVKREDQIENAVSFLRHPKVRGSPEASKRSFLLQKGLNSEEIDEAFRRVPQLPIASASPNDAVSGFSAPNTNNGHMLSNSSALVERSKSKRLSEASWTQVAMGASFVAAAVYAMKQIAWPYMVNKWPLFGSSLNNKNAKRNVHDKQLGQISEETVSPMQVISIAEAIRDQTAELAKTISAMQRMVEKLEDKQTSALTIDDLRRELMAARAEESTNLGDDRKKESSPSVSGTKGPFREGFDVGLELAEIKAMLSEYVKTPRSTDNSSTPRNFSQVTGVLASVGSVSGENKYSRKVGTRKSAEPTTNRKYSTDLGATLAKQMEKDPNESALPILHRTMSNGAMVNREKQPPGSYVEVLEMLEKGITPPGIRTDINDKPPNPLQPLPEPKAKPLRKPWEVNGSSNEDYSRPSQNASDMEESKHVGTSAGMKYSTEDEQASASTPRVASYQASDVSTSVKGSTSPLQALAGNTKRKVASLFQAIENSAEEPGVVAGKFSPERNADSSNASFPTQPKLSLDIGMIEAEPYANGHGLGRPSSRTWKPPPIPMPTLTHESKNTSESANNEGIGILNQSVNDEVKTQ